MALSVKLYRVVGKGKDRRYVPIDLGRRGRRSREEVTGPFYLRYGLKYESVGMDFKSAAPSESDRWKESGAATSRPNVCGFPPVTRVALPDAPVARDPVADGAVPREPELSWWPCCRPRTVSVPSARCLSTC
jgi:hypothetical protein